MQTNVDHPLGCMICTRNHERMYDTFLVGLATQARDGGPFATIDAAMTEIMSVWDHYVVTARP